MLTHTASVALMRRAAILVDDRPWFDRKAPLTRAQFVAAWRAGVIPIEIYRLGHQRYVALFRMRQSWQAWRSGS